MSPLHDIYLDIVADSTSTGSSVAQAFSLELQEAEENFDLSLVASLEIDVVPHLGDKRVPDALVAQLSRILQQGSAVYDSEVDSSIISPSNLSGSGSSLRSIQQINVEDKYNIGNTDFGALVPRERFSYWSFDLLFLICSDTTKGASLTLYLIK